MGTLLLGTRPTHRTFKRLPQFVGVFSLSLILMGVFLACSPAADIGPGSVGRAQATLIAAQADSTGIAVQLAEAQRQTDAAVEAAKTVSALETQQVQAAQQLALANKQAEDAIAQHAVERQWTSEAHRLEAQGTVSVLNITLEAVPPQQTVAAGTAQAVAAQAEATREISNASISAARAVISETAKAEVDRQQWNSRTQVMWTLGDWAKWNVIPLLAIAFLVYLGLRALRIFEIRQRVVKNDEGIVVGIITFPKQTGDPTVRIVESNQLSGQSEYPQLPSGEPSLDEDGDEASLPTNPGPLDLGLIPGPLMLPIGITRQHPEGLWIPLIEADSLLIAGARRKGKTNLVKTMIQSLVVSRSARLVLFDGKSGVEFGPYRNIPRCRVVEEQELLPTLREVQRELGARIDAFKREGATNVTDFNKRVMGRGAMDRLVIVVDELAFALQEDGVEDVLVDLIARGGAFGVHPILATQRPSVDVITPQIKANLSTRIALPVASAVDSRVILDRGGAERLLKIPGRLLLLWDAQLIEAQAWLAPEDLPETVTRGRRQITAASPDLTDLDRAMAEAAVENDGRFAIDRIYKILRERGIVVARQNILKTAQEWEKRGWLTEEQRKPNGQSDSRHVTQQLLGLISPPGSLGTS